jgi:hypothetical protein
MNEPKPMPKPVDWDELFPGRFIKAGDFKGEKVTLRISMVKIEELVGDKGPQIKGVIGFERTDKHWALNKTNGICLREMFGRMVQDWVGHRVTLFAAIWDGEPAIRVWGSPELGADREVNIQLPRKRPFKMTMHRVLPKGATAAPPVQQQQRPAAEQVEEGLPTGSAPVPDEPGEKPSAESAKQTLREAKTLEALKDARGTVWGLYAAARSEVPLDVEFVATTQRERLEAQE